MTLHRTARHVEFGSGLLAGVIGVGWVGSKLLFGISGVRTYIDPAGGPNVVEITRQPLQSFGLLAVVIASLLLVASVGAGVGSYRHSQRGGWDTLAILWASTAILVVGAALVMYSLGIVLPVVALLALLASLAGSWVHFHTPRGHPI